MTAIKVTNIEDGAELAHQVFDHLEFSVENEGIGSYEVWGHNGNQVQFAAVLKTHEIQVEIPSIAELIPITGIAFGTIGGCRGDHNKCNKECEEFGVAISLKLISAKTENDLMIATYAVTQVEV